MSPDFYRRRSVSVMQKSQRGFLIPLAIFIVVVMSFFAIALWRTTVQTTLSGAQELVSVQAFYAAESGAQEAMQVLFFPDASDRTAINDRCEGMDDLNDIEISFNGVAGLNGCVARIDCECLSCASDTSSYYTITSTGTCGSGLMSASRTLRVGSFMDQQD